MSTSGYYLIVVDFTGTIITIRTINNNNNAKSPPKLVILGRKYLISTLQIYRTQIAKWNI